VLLDFDAVIVGSWDTEDFKVLIDGVEVHSATYAHSGASSNVCGNSWKEWEPQPLSLSVAHSANSVTIEVQGHINSGINDEAIGFDNVVVAVK
jgi:hypothetical protein